MKIRCRHCGKMVTRRGLTHHLVHECNFSISPEKILEEDREFLHLVKQGLTADAIAARLNLPMAEAKYRLEGFGPIPQNRKEIRK